MLNWLRDEIHRDLTVPMGVAIAAIAASAAAGYIAAAWQVGAIP